MQTHKGIGLNLDLYFHKTLSLCFVSLLLMRQPTWPTGLVNRYTSLMTSLKSKRTRDLLTYD